MLFHKLRIATVISALLTTQSAQGQESTSSGYCLDLLPYAGYTISDELIVTTTGDTVIATVTGDYFVSPAAFDAETMLGLRMIELRKVQSYLAIKDDQHYVVAEVPTGAAEPGCVRYPIQ